MCRRKSEVVCSVVRDCEGVKINLADTKVRQAMVAEAVWLTTVCGFDGVQWDYEICDDNDPNLPVF